MKTRTVVLNENPDAAHSWPVSGTLAEPKYEYGENFYTVKTKTWRHCCLGCLGLTYGLSASTAMYKLDYLSACNIELGFKIDTEEIPESVVERIRELYPFGGHNINEYHGFEEMASRLNDNLSTRLYEATREDVDAVVECIRVLFRWRGEQLGERWVIRHLKDDRIFGGDNED